MRIRDNLQEGDHTQRKTMNQVMGLWVKSVFLIILNYERTVKVKVKSAYEPEWPSYWAGTYVWFERSVKQLGAFNLLGFIHMKGWKETLWELSVLLPGLDKCLSICSIPRFDMNTYRNPDPVRIGPTTAILYNPLMLILNIKKILSIVTHKKALFKAPSMIQLQSN